MREGDVLALPARPRILVVMLAAVGDAVHAMSTLTFLRRARPDAHVSWVLQPGLAPFVRGHPAVDEVLEFDRKLGRRGFAAIRTRLAGERYDAVLVLQPYLKAGIVAAFARAPHRLGFDRRRARDASWLFANRHLPARPLAHTQDMYLEFLDALGVPHGVPEAASDWQVGPWPEERRGRPRSSHGCSDPWRRSSSARPRPRRTGCPSAGPRCATRSPPTTGCSRCSAADAPTASSPPRR
jgi:heptosyltransferase I